MTKTIAYSDFRRRAGSQKYLADILHLANEKSLGKVQGEEIISSRISWKKRPIEQILNWLSDGDNLTVFYV